MDAVVGLCGWVLAAIGWSMAVGAVRSRGKNIDSVMSASHELRGPITAAQLALAFGTRTGELSGRRLQAVDRELQQAALVLEDLAPASVPVSTRERQEVRIRELVVDCVETWRALDGGPDMRIELGSGADVRVCGDALRLGQAVRNLISNAVEHGGGSVTVRVVSATDPVRVEVADDGPGLQAPLDTLARRARRSSRSRGRGLAIAAAVAADHGGRLATAPSERGARLVLELPASATTSAES